jgi:hypothetical protein
MGLAFRPDGQALAVNVYHPAFRSASSSVVIGLPLGLRDWRAQACRIANRNLTWDEWRQFFPDEPYRRTWRSFPWPSDLPEAERPAEDSHVKLTGDDDPA